MTSRTDAPLGTRSYTADELDDLRDALKAKHPNEPSLEIQVRTHMIAGHTAQDINPHYPQRQLCTLCGESVRYLPAHMSYYHKYPPIQDRK